MGLNFSISLLLHYFSSHFNYWILPSVLLPGVSSSLNIMIAVLFPSLISNKVATSQPGYFPQWCSLCFILFISFSSWFRSANLFLWLICRLGRRVSSLVSLSKQYVKFVIAMCKQIHDADKVMGGWQIVGFVKVHIRISLNIAGPCANPFLFFFKKIHLRICIRFSDYQSPKFLSI